MEFRSISLGDLLVMNGTLYHVTHIFSVPARYTIQLTHYSENSLPVNISLSGKDYKQLQEVNSIYYLGNIQENEALTLLYS